jgi:hypothetical protein
MLHPKLASLEVAGSFRTRLVGLMVDQHGGLIGQLAVSAWTWVLFVYLLDRVDRQVRLPLMLCLTISTAGEILLSLVWGLYQYRLHNVPLFIPPGHVLLFILGLTAAPRVPRWLLAAAPALAAAYGVRTLATGIDTVSAVLAAIFVVCTILGSGRRLYVAMFVLALALELYGTWVGNWAWFGEIPWLPLTSANPPLCVGAFYSVLDLMVMRAACVIQRRWPAAEAAPATG